MKLNDRVVSLVAVEEDGLDVCRPGDVGRVVHLESDGSPLVRFDRTSRAYLMDPDDEVIIVGGVASSVPAA